MAKCPGNVTEDRDHESELQPPEDFPFPFQPYDIQKEFMHALYMALERGCIGIFESPTGTVGLDSTRTLNTCAYRGSCMHNLQMIH